MGGGLRRPDKVRSRTDILDSSDKNLDGPTVVEDGLRGGKEGDTIRIPVINYL